MLLDVAFDDDMNLISLENRILQLEEYRRRYLSKKCFGYAKRIINKDNQKSCYNSGNGGGNCNKVRVPSLKRSNAVWRRFYELFPEYEKMSHDPDKRRQYNLKKI